MLRAVFAVLAASASLVAASANATTTTANGYEVTRSQAVVPVPRGKLGRKTIDRESRVGVTEETDGNSTSFTMTMGGFVAKCPVPEGDPLKFVIVGDFEFSLVVDDVDTDVVPTARKHYRKRVTARIKAVVNDDLSITDADFDGEYTADLEGVRTGPVAIRRHFRIGAGGMPERSALEDVAVTSDLATAALMWIASQTVMLTQPLLYEPNACAELEFDPPSESRAVGPGETVEIRVKYRTREERLPIPKGTWDAQPVQGGTIPEHTGPVGNDGTFLVRYTARTSSDPKEGDGARIEARSAGGYARDTWKIRVGGDYEIAFESTIVSRDPVQSVRSNASGSVRLTSSTKPWRRKPDGKQYLLYDGNGTVQFSSGPGPERDPCSPLIAGSGTSTFQVLETRIQVTPPSEGTPGKADVQMTYWIAQAAGETETTPTYVDFRCVPRDVDPMPYWWMAYGSSRGAEAINFLGNWEYVGQGDVVARKILTGDCGGLCTEERSVFTLRRVRSQ